MPELKRSVTNYPFCGYCYGPLTPDVITVEEWERRNRAETVEQVAEYRKDETSRCKIKDCPQFDIPVHTWRDCNAPLP